MDPDADCEKIRNLLQGLDDDEDEDPINISGEDSEPDEEIHSEHDSVSEQSDEEESEGDCDGPTYIGKDKVTKWRRHKIQKNVRTRQQNIVTHLPGVRAEGRMCKTPQDCFLLFLDDTLIQEIVRCTNLKIEKDVDKHVNDLG